LLSRNGDIAGIRGLAVFGGVRDYNSNVQVLQIDEIAIMRR